MEFHKLYAEMAAAAEKSIAEIEAANYGSAKEALIAALRNCEELYISGQEADRQDEPLQKGKTKPPQRRLCGGFYHSYSAT